MSRTRTPKSELIDVRKLLELSSRNFRNKRKKLGYSLRSLAKDNMNPSVIFHFEGARDPKLSTVYAVCACLGVEPADILPKLSEVKR